MAITEKPGFFEFSGSSSSLKTMRKSLVLGLVFANIVIFFLIGYLQYQTKQQFEVKATALSQSVAISLDQSVSKSIEKIDFALVELQGVIEKDLATQKHVNETTLNPYLNAFKAKLPEVENFRVVDDNGFFIVGQGVGNGSRLRVSDRDYFIYHRAHDQGGLYVGKPVMGRLIHRMVLVFSRRYNHPDGSFAGVINAIVETEYLNDLLAKFDAGPNGHIFIRNTGKYDVVASNAGRLAAQKNEMGNLEISQELRNLLDAGVVGGTIVVSQSSDGQNRTISFRRLVGAPMIIIVGIATDDYLDGWKQNLYWYIAILLGFVFLTSLFGIWFLRLINRTERSESERVELVNEKDIILNSRILGIAKLKDRHFVWVSSTLAEWFDYSPSELIGKTTQILFPTMEGYIAFGENIYPELQKGVAVRTEFEFRRRNGTLCWYELCGAILDDRKNESLWVFFDISERKKLEAQVLHQALYDALTDLPNRRLLNDRLQQVLASNRRSRRHGALLFIDLDNFKPLNDAHGHDMGDLLLVEVAERLKKCVREVDTVARIGGDEVVVLVFELEMERDLAVGHANAIAQKICRVLRMRYLLPSRAGGENPFIEYYCTASIGIDLFASDETNGDAIVQRADEAMYEAKSAGRNTVRMYQAKPPTDCA